MAFDFPNFDPVAVHLGPLQIRWYALAYLAGFLAGWRYAVYLAGKNKERPNKTDIDDFIPWAIAGVILGGRIGYVLFYNFDEYMYDFAEVFKIWHGGMSFHGGVLGVIASVVIYAKWKKFSVRRLADVVCCAAPIGLCLGRIANFVNGELYGRETDVWWAVKFPSGGLVPRHPSQLYEAFLEGIVLFAILFVLARVEKIREKPGILAGVFLIGYGCFRTFVELFREPDWQLGFIFEGVSMGQILCAPMIALGICVIVYAINKKVTTDGHR